MTATTTLTIWCDHGGPQACGAFPSRDLCPRHRGEVDPDA